MPDEKGFPCSFARLGSRRFTAAFSVLERRPVGLWAAPVSLLLPSLLRGMAWPEARAFLEERFNLDIDETDDLYLVR